MTRWYTIMLAAAAASGLVAAALAQASTIVHVVEWATAARAWAAKPRDAVQPAVARQPDLAKPERPKAVVPPPPRREHPAVAAPPRNVTDTGATCELPLRISAVWFDRHRPTQSVVALRGSRPSSGGIASVGTTMGAYRLAEVRPRSARFEHHGTSCWLRMFGAGARDKVVVEDANARAAAKAAKRRRPRPARFKEYPPTRALTPAEIARGIRELRPGSYVLDRRVLRKALSRWDHVAATTRTSAAKAKGKGKGKAKRKRGLRIVRVRPDGVLEALGLRVGDVLREFNGRRFSRKTRLRQALAELVDTERSELTLQRDHHPLKLEYIVR